MKSFTKKSGLLFRISAIGFALISFAFYFPPLAETHRYHSSLTRMDYNQRSKTIEISIQMFTHDLVPLLEKRYGNSVDLDKSAVADKLIQDYLKENFTLKTKSGEPATFKWVGKESNVDLTYVYLEMPFQESLEGASLENTLFFESFPEQTNLVLCRFEEKKADLLFKVGESRKEIKVRIAAGD